MQSNANACLHAKYFWVVASDGIVNFVFASCRNGKIWNPDTTSVQTELPIHVILAPFWLCHGSLVRFLGIKKVDDIENQF